MSARPLVLRGLVLVDRGLRPLALLSLALGLDDLQSLGLVLLLRHPWNVARTDRDRGGRGRGERVHAMIGR